MAATRLIAMHVNKGKTIAQCLKDRTEYAKNEKKTDGGALIRGFECDPELVEAQFAAAKRIYFQKTGKENRGDIIAYQIRQSFKPGEITPEEANAVGYETAMRFTKGEYAFIVATHIDKEHIHNHVIFNSTNLDCDRKFRNFFYSGIALQRVSDIVCLEHGLSVIKKVMPGQREKRTVYPQRLSHRDEIRKAIDEALLKKPKDINELFLLLEEMEFIIRRSDNPAIKYKDYERVVKFKSLGDGYSLSALERRIAGESIKDFSNNKQSNDRKIDMLVDIEKKISEGKGIGYQNWAKVYNIKQISKTLVYLQERGIRNYAELEKMTEKSSERFHELSTEIKKCEKRIAEIKELRTQIFNYSKTRDIYSAYRKSGYSKKFFEENREALLLHKAARDAFKNLDGKIPKVKDLNEKATKLYEKKKEAYAEYGEIKKEMKELLIAKRNVDMFLGNKNENEKQVNKEELL